MSSKITAVVTKDGNVEVDIDLPAGAQCDAIDADLRALLAIFGTVNERAMDITVKSPRQPEAIRTRRRATSRR